MMKHITAILSVLLLIACGGSDKTPEDVLKDSAGDAHLTDTPGDASTDAKDQLGDEDTAEVEIGDTADDPGDAADDQSEVAQDIQEEIWYPEVNPPLPFGPENRGYEHKTGIVHIHSRWSHDGCFPDHAEITSPEIEACAVNNQEQVEIDQCKADIIEEMLNNCVNEYRNAPCANGKEFMFQTDHPNYVRYQSFENALHYRPLEGDQMLRDDQDRLLANKMKCPAGSPIDYTYIYYGIEGSQQMPIGMADPIPDIVFDISYHDAIPLEHAQAALAAAQEQGGIGLICHPEQKDISVERIVAMPLELIEIFNFHPALMVLVEDITSLFTLDRFISDDDDAPNPDLSVMLVLKPIEKDVLKFDEAVKSIRLGHILATDIHRNVEVPSICSDVESCQENFFKDEPNLARLFTVGGPAILSDGDRIDSYIRSLKWASNHAWVDKTAPEHLAIRDAIGKARSYSAFDILGQADSFDLFAVVDEQPLEMGEEAKNYTDAKIYFRTPTVVKPLFASAKFGDPKDAEIVTKLIKIDAEQGSQVVKEVVGQGWTFEHPVDGPAIYRIEVWMTPKHLAADLGDLAWMADQQYPWIYSNALFFR